MMQILSVDQVAQLSGVKCVVYGSAGVGKTRLAATCPSPIILSAEQGLLSLRGANLPCLPEIRSLPELIAAHNWVLNDRQAQQFKTVFVDSITEIAEVVLRVEKTNNKDGRKAHDNAAELIINTVFRNFRDIKGRNVVMIAKERQVEDQMTHVFRACPDMPNGKLRTALPHYFDFLFRYVHTVGSDGQPWSGLQCGHTPTGDAKDRSGRLSLYEPPHLGNIFAKAMQ